MTCLKKQMVSICVVAFQIEPNVDTISVSMNAHSQSSPHCLRMDITDFHFPSTGQGKILRRWQIKDLHFDGCNRNLSTSVSYTLVHHRPPRNILSSREVWVSFSYSFTEVIIPEKNAFSHIRRWLATRFIRFPKRFSLLSPLSLMKMISIVENKVLICILFSLYQEMLFRIANIFGFS